MKTNICLSLGLPEFTILNQQEQENRILLRVMTHTGPKRCPHCGFIKVKHHDQRVRKVRDLDLLGKSLFLLIQVRRWYCLNCEAVFSEELPSVPPGKHQTYRFREHIFKMCQDTTISYVSRQIHMSYKTVERIYYDLAAPSIPDIEPSAVIGIDEVAVRKGHRYETVVSDLLTGHVHLMGANRDTSSTIQLLAPLAEYPIQAVVMDMWRPFYKAVQQVFPNTPIVIDKYHVVQKINHAFDQIRKNTQHQVKGLKKGRYALLKRPFRLTEKQFQKLDHYHQESQELAHAYYLKEWFYDFYEQPNIDEARNFLAQWIEAATSSPFKPYHELVKTLESWKMHILKFFELPYTNARTEGTNHKIKNRKRMSYGFRNLEHFRIRVKLECSSRGIHPSPSSPSHSLADVA